MLDLHCHILPGVDDGATDLEESVAMLDAAKRAGVNEIVATPHVRKPYFKGIETYEAIINGYRNLAPMAAQRGITLRLGFEVNHYRLQEIGMEWAEHLGFDTLRYAYNQETGEGRFVTGQDALPADAPHYFLLEFEVGASERDFQQDYERTIFALQGMGYKVIIAHPERYSAIRNNIEIAKHLVSIGCKLQCSSDYIAGGRLGKERKPAQRMLKAGLYSYLGSDAHCVRHYDLFARASRDW